MLPDKFDIKVGPNDEKSPVPVKVHIVVDDKLLGLGAFAILGLIAYAKIRSKK